MQWFELKLNMIIIKTPHLINAERSTNYPSSKKICNNPFN